MNTQTATPAVIRLGFWSALLSAGTFLLFTIAFVAIVMAGNAFTWTNLADYSAKVQEINQSWKHLAQASMLLFAPLFVVLLHAIHESAPVAKRPFSRIAVSFAVIFATLVSAHYFVQLTTVRLSLAHGAPDGLEQFVQLRPYAAITALNMLGVTLFLGLASLFMAPLFAAGRLERVIRAAFVVNGIACLGGAVAYLADNALLVFLLTNFGMGGAVFILTLALSLYFRRLMVL